MSRDRSVSLLLVSPLLVVSVLFATPVGPSAAGAEGRARPTYAPPVDAPVVDPFRPPEHPFGPGNRGLEYGTAPQTEVHAAADGEVLFSGPVAGTLHVTVLHEDGVRTTYSFLRSVRVARGAHVTQGQILGTTVDHLHFGARVGDVYIDPALLFGEQYPSVRLVPLSSSDTSWLSERLSVLDFVGGTIGSLASSHAEIASAWLHYVSELNPGVRSARVAGGLWDWWSHRDECTPADVEPEPPAERRIVVLVGGLGTTDTSTSLNGLDTAALGYTKDDVIRFSYRGGRIPADIEGPLARIPEAEYDKADTEGDLLEAGSRLLSLLQQVNEAQPGVPVDIIAHSQGGVVARAALLDASVVPPDIANLVTLGSPHQGSDLATAVSAIREAPLGPGVLALAEQRLHTGLDHDAVSIGQLSETSDFTARLEGTAPPPGVEFTSIGARGDLVVTAGHTRAPAGDSIIVPLWGRTAHSRVANDPSAQREVALAIAGQDPTCESWSDVSADLIVSEAISYSEDALGARVLMGVGG